MLVSPNVDIEERKAVMPLGIASLAGELRDHGYNDITLIDGCYLVKKHGYVESFGEIEDEIKARKPFVVGCSHYSITGLQTSQILTYALEQGSHVILGGHDATAKHESLAEGIYKAAQKINPSSVVAVVRGEGEKTTKELIAEITAK